MIILRTLVRSISGCCCKPQYLGASVLKLFSTHDVYDCNLNIGSLFRTGKVEDARQVFDKMPHRDVVTWNSLITGYWQNGHFKESKRLFESMPVRNVVSWNSMIAGCVENGMVDEAFYYFRAMPRRNIASWNAMICGFLKSDRVEEASRLFEEMPCRNVVSYTAMIDGYGKRGEVEKARGLFDVMPRKNQVSWTVMISGYVENGRFDEARELYKQMPEKNVVAVTAMITGCCKEGKVEEARVLFDEIQSIRRNHNWVVEDFIQRLLVEKKTKTISMSYAQNSRGEEALKLHSLKLKIGLHPDNWTLVSVLMACSALASLKDGRQAHVLIIKHGFESNVSICNALITMYCRCGAVLDSELAFNQIESPDLVSWNTIVAAFARHGLYEKAVGFFNQMKLSGFELDDITFLSVLSARARAGKVNESIDLFDSMVNNYGISPRSEHYACLVDLLSRAGQLKKACKMIQEMPFEADFGIWDSLLAASSVHSNIEIGELAAKNMLYLDPQNSGPFVILSNMYAAAGKWNDVARVRSLMKEHGVKKQQAYSWTEIGSKVDNFFGGDISHPDVDKVHLVLKNISLHMLAADNFADISVS